VTPYFRIAVGWGCAELVLWAAQDEQQMELALFDLKNSIRLPV
jgi:hypothetical protein